MRRSWLVSRWVGRWIREEIEAKTYTSSTTGVRADEVIMRSMRQMMRMKVALLPWRMMTLLRTILLMVAAQIIRIRHSIRDGTFATSIAWFIAWQNYPFLTAHIEEARKATSSSSSKMHWRCPCTATFTNSSEAAGSCLGEIPQDKRFVCGSNKCSWNINHDPRYSICCRCRPSKE